MANDFIFNDNKVVFDNEEMSHSTKTYNFPNDASSLEHDFQPFGSYTATTFTVTFSDGGSGTSVTQTVNPFQTIGFAISEKKLTKSGFYPTYYYNESIVTEESEVKITSDVDVKVVWKAKV